jgi:hypothetical protein
VWGCVIATHAKHFTGFWPDWQGTKKGLAALLLTLILLDSLEKLLPASFDW